ncbi:MAG TPA: aminotransferase class III-fold pyridoxal phosphate-dependent enzyme, partial [Rhizomicrobium sp.]|nr:aminotransferase class III-fold pyridoxal phosphate-dependent enzyme [Rhizomicrobium sp.]
GEHPLVGEVCGIGLIGAIELVADKESKASFDPAKFVAPTVFNFAQEEGVITRATIGDRIAFCPPLIITQSEIDELFDRFTRALDRGLDWVKRQGLLQ